MYIPKMADYVVEVLTIVLCKELYMSDMHMYTCVYVCLYIYKCIYICKKIIQI